MSFAHDLDFDSLDNVELVVAVEEEFGIELPDHEVEFLDTVGDLCQLVDEKIVKAAAG